MIRRLILALLAAALFLPSAGCTVTVSTPTATPAPSPTRKPTVTPLPQPVEIVVLHTNDALGYTEPCG